MYDTINRRDFLGFGASSLVAGALPKRHENRDLPIADPTVAFFRQDATLVQDIVSASHNNISRVRELLERQPALAKASFDWGFGDWESPIDAAAHVGQRDIAELLIKAGARPTIFSAAMLGQLAVVQAFVAASPGVQRTLGPHSITLASHARAGGAPAKAVLAYLEQLGDADLVPAFVSPTPADRARYLGTYAFGSGPDQRLVIGLAGEAVFVERPGVAKRTIRYLGNHEFRPAGAESVRLRFEVSAAAATAVRITAPELLVTATRV